MYQDIHHRATVLSFPQSPTQGNCLPCRLAGHILASGITCTSLPYSAYYQGMLSPCLPPHLAQLATLCIQVLLQLSRQVEVRQQVVRVEHVVQHHGDLLVRGLVIEAVPAQGLVGLVLRGGAGQGRVVSRGCTTWWGGPCGVQRRRAGARGVGCAGAGERR